MTQNPSYRQNPLSRSAIKSAASLYRLSESVPSLKIDAYSIFSKLVESFKKESLQGFFYFSLIKAITQKGGARKKGVVQIKLANRLEAKESCICFCVPRIISAPNAEEKLR